VYLLLDTDISGTQSFFRVLHRKPCYHSFTSTKQPTSRIMLVVTQANTPELIVYGAPFFSEQNA